MSKLIIKFSNGDIEEINDVLCVEWESDYAMWVERESDYAEVPKDKCVAARGHWYYDFVSFTLER